MPVNFWLPRAYVAAPRAFVPVLAGATLNLGLYGILRVNADLMPATHAGPGLVALVVGTLSALVGILYATTDNDLKIMLAHSSIENVGIIVAGFGAGMVFVATNHPALAAIAFVAALVSFDQSFALQNAAVFRRGRGGNANRHARHGPTRRLDQMDAADRARLFSSARCPSPRCRRSTVSSANGSRCKPCCARRNCPRPAQKWFSPCAARDWRSRRRWR